MRCKLSSAPRGIAMCGAAISGSRGLIRITVAPCDAADGGHGLPGSQFDHHHPLPAQLFDIEQDSMKQFDTD